LKQAMCHCVHNPGRTEVADIIRLISDLGDNSTGGRAAMSAPCDGHLLKSWAVKIR
jgi:hypothetical protein